MNRIFLSLLGRIVFASVSLVFCQTAANAQESEWTAIGSQKAENLAQEQQIIENTGANVQILVQRSTRRERRENNSLVPKAVAEAAIANLAQQTGIDAATLKVLEAKQVTWTDGCLGLGSPGLPCAEGRVPGWELVVANDNQRWVYRSNMSGSLVKLDALGTQAIASRPFPAQETASQTEPQRTSNSRRTNRQRPSQTRTANTPNQTPPRRRVEKPSPTAQEATPQTQETTATTRTETANSPNQTTTSTRRRQKPSPTAPEATQTQETTATTRRQPETPASTAQKPSSQTMMAGNGEFSLAIWQPSANLSEVVTRLSAKSKQGDGFSPERYIGDYRYRVNQRARYVGGINPGDRIVARLYNFQNQLIGYSEFEVLPQNMAVNLILSNRPLLTRVVRTVYGIDADRNVAIDRGAEIFDYYTQITGTTATQERVTFMGDVQNIDKTWFQVAGLPVPPQTSTYPTAYSNVANQTVNVFGSDLPTTITANPGDSVINVQTDNTYNFASQTSQTAQATRPTPETRPTSQATRSTPEITPSDVQANFADVPSDFWAKSFISQLAVKGVLQGYPDGLYRPKDTVTRAEFATIISGAFKTEKRREVIAFKDVPTNYWAYPAIRDAYEKGFLDADSSRNFNPDEKISRLDVLVALAKGLNYSPSGSADRVLRVYRDAGTIPRSDRNLVAAVTERNIVVNYPNVRSLNPRREATRAEVAALIYRALVSTGEMADISSPYVVEESAATEEVREQPRATPRRQTAPTRRINNNNGGRQTQPSRRSSNNNSSNTNRVRRTTTVQRSDRTNSAKRATTMQRSSNNNSVRNTSAVRRES